MILIVVAAIFGAALGLYLRPRILALAVAISISGAAHLLIAYVARLAARSPGHEKLVAQLDFVAFTGLHGVWPAMAAAGTGTLLAALAWSAVRKEPTDGFWFPGEDTDRRNRIRSMTMVEERPVHAEAREWLDDILKR
jgi:hypothetical protein